MSQKHFSFGPVAVKSRCSRSRALSTAASSAIVVRFHGRGACLRSRAHRGAATWSRPASTPRCSSFQVCGRRTPPVAGAGGLDLGEEFAVTQLAADGTRICGVGALTGTPSRRQIGSSPKAFAALPRSGSRRRVGQAPLRNRRGVLQDRVRTPRSATSFRSRFSSSRSSSSAVRDGGPDQPRPAHPLPQRFLVNAQVARDMRDRPIRLEEKRTTHSRHSSEHFLGLAIAGASPPPRTEPGVAVSRNPGPSSGLWSGIGSLGGAAFHSANGHRD